MYTANQLSGLQYSIYDCNGVQDEPCIIVLYCSYEQIYCLEIFFCVFFFAIDEVEVFLTLCKLTLIYIF